MSRPLQTLVDPAQCAARVLRWYYPLLLPLLPCCPDPQAFTPRTEKSELSLTTPRTSRSHYTPSSAAKELAPASSQKHIERLASARLRQSGVFSGSAAADSLRSSVASSASGFHTHRPSTASGCRVTSAAAVAGSSPAPSGSLTARSRTSYSVTGPAAAAAGKPPSGSMTARGATSAYASRWVMDGRQRGRELGHPS